ncbi:TPA: hypothetical protein DEP96_03760 [Candidatus Uhrbacteria bacterium]|nr:hypothetical protein [Candidatus Uhrbacteria bacterium]
MFNTILAIFGLLFATVIGTWLAIFINRKLNAESAANSSPMIDGDAAPVEPDWAVKGKTVHNKHGKVNPTKLEFFQTEEMVNGGNTIGDQLSGKTRQAKLNPLNANGAVFLKTHEEFLRSVPKGIYCLIFTETKFLDRYGRWGFRCLDRGGVGGWYFGYYLVGRRFDGRDAVVAFRE